MIHTDQAVVIRLSDYSETSQIASLLTAGQGLVRVIAKGLRRASKARAAVGLDLLEYGEAQFVPPRGDAGLGVLVSWSQRDAFTALRRQPLPIYAGLYAAELLHACTQEHDAHPGLFDALLTLLRELAGETPAGAAASIVRFQADLLRSIGLAPSLRQCVGCGAPRVRGSPAYFSSSAGGLLCAACAPRHVEKHEIAASLVDGPRGSTTPAQWFALLDYHLACVAGRPFRTSPRLHALIREHADEGRLAEAESRTSQSAAGPTRSANAVRRDC